MQLLSHVVMNQWARFDEIETIALKSSTGSSQSQAKGIGRLPIDPRLTKLLDLDIRISLSWDPIWTTSTSGSSSRRERRAYYGHNRTTIGGLVSRDFTQATGPEEYVIKTAIPANTWSRPTFFGSSAQSVDRTVTLQLSCLRTTAAQREAAVDSRSG